MIPNGLSAALSDARRLVIAVSGGIDSLTLAAAAAKVRHGRATVMCHATSPAVPGDALPRVRDMAARLALPLMVVEAGEFADPSYRANPVNRCFFCKGHLYTALSRVEGAIAAGTNMDDLGDFRPGLQAAAQHGVRHPFVEAGLDKAAVRALARDLGLGQLAELPSSPCLSSRVRTGVRIEPHMLQRIDRIEAALRARLGGVTLRCRQDPEGLVVEIEAATLNALTAQERDAIGVVAGQAAGMGALPLRAYNRGSAFIHA